MWYSTPHKLLKNFKLIEARTPFCLRPRHGSRHFASTKRWDRIRQCTFPKFINHHDQLWCLIPRGIFYSRPSIQKKQQPWIPPPPFQRRGSPPPPLWLLPPPAPRLFIQLSPLPGNFYKRDHFFSQGGFTHLCLRGVRAHFLTTT